MKLIKLKLRNFRCYQQEVEFLIDDLTAIIGKNDIGKSSILEALDGFFNDNIEESDLSNNADNRTIELTCFFSGLPDQIVLDTSVPTSPSSEGILNSNNELEVRKTFTFSGRKSIAVYLCAEYPSDGRLEKLLSLKNGALKALATELDIDLTGVNKAKNPPLREKIREFIGGGRSRKILKVEGSLDTEDNLKTIWSSISKMLPVFSLFKVDKVLDDKDGDIKDPMQVAINEALALPEIQELLQTVEEKVRAASTEVADRTIEKLKDFDASLSERLKSEFSKAPSYNKIFDLTLLNENNIPLNKRGSGIRRLVLLSFFQAQAERRKAKESAPGIIYAIEEPETSQHPNHQKMLINALIRLSQQQGVQILFTTHNANLVREIPIHSLRYISLNNGQLSIETGKNLADGSNNDAVITKVIQALGILPNPADKVKVLVYVEGNHDVNALKRYSVILNTAENEIINLTGNPGVGYVITGGSALKHYIEQKHLEGLGKPEVHIYDNDVPEYRAAVESINAENNPQKIAYNTTKLELETFLHSDAIIEAYAANNLQITLDPIDNDHDVPTIVAEKIYALSGGDWAALSEHEKKAHANSKKKLLNTQAVERMTIQRLQERGGLEEIKGWLNKIKSYTV